MIVASSLVSYHCSKFFKVIIAANIIIELFCLLREEKKCVVCVKKKTDTYFYVTHSREEASHSVHAIILEDGKITNKLTFIQCISWKPSIQ